MDKWVFHITVQYLIDDKLIPEIKKLSKIKIKYRNILFGQKSIWIEIFQQCIWYFFQTVNKFIINCFFHKHVKNYRR
jgi:hypothetical protein